jgi:amidohydrolase
MYQLDHTESLLKLRKQLHQLAETGGNEHHTTAKIIEYIRPFEPYKIITEIAKTGVAFIFKGLDTGPTTMIRCDIDALAIEETINLSYKSNNPGVSHKCGHDGHSTIVAGLAHLLNENKPTKGRVVLLFQPAEESGQGAQWIMEDKKFSLIEPDYIFSLHNIPGFNLGSIIVGNGNFASASKGLLIKIFGKTSHASEPEKGLSPAAALAEIIGRLPGIPEKELFSDQTMITICHARLGEPTYGTSPGYGEIMATLRAYQNEDMIALSDHAVKAAAVAAQKYGLILETSWQEEFSATVNHDFCVDIIEKAADKNQLPVLHIEKPFQWSEDFGMFTKKYKGALFGIGAGTGHPPLHSPEYDFPDKIIETGIKMFNTIIRTLN